MKTEKQLQAGRVCQNCFPHWKHTTRLRIKRLGNLENVENERLVGGIIISPSALILIRLDRPIQLLKISEMAMTIQGRCKRKASASGLHVHNIVKMAMCARCRKVKITCGALYLLHLLWALLLLRSASVALARAWQVELATVQLLVLAGAEDIGWRGKQVIVAGRRSSAGEAGRA